MDLETVRMPNFAGRRVAVFGGGLAGIAAASALVQHGFQVTLYEARTQLGGRAGSYHDQGSDECLDNCQHVSMGCCTNLRQLCADLGIGASFEVQPQLYFVSPEGQICTFKESWLPAPFHLTAAFLKLPYLSFHERRKFAKAVKALATATEQELRGQRFRDWLLAHKQTETLIKRVWEVVLVSALSESLERIDAAYARKVFVDGFLANRTGWRVEIPTESLEALYSVQASTMLKVLGVQIRCQRRLKRLHIVEDQVTVAELSGGKFVSADDFILAIPQHQLRRLFPEELAEHPTLMACEKMETAPISSVHFWLDRKVTELPHAVFVERFSQWMFQRTVEQQDGGDRHRYQVVISASRDLVDLTHSEVIELVMNDLRSVFPLAVEAKVMHARVITEKRAVFSVTPGIDHLRPAQQSFLENLQFAGDWTQTGWPATMEGAVRSGYLAAQNLLKKRGIDVAILAPDLPQTWLSKCFFGVRSSI